MMEIPACDVLFLAIPPVEIRGPLIGPSLLKSIVMNSTLKNARCVDLNLDFYGKIKDINSDVANECETGVGSLIFGFISEYRKFYSETYEEILDDWTSAIITSGARLIGMTSFSMSSTFTIMDLSRKIKERSQRVRIVVGGSGARTMIKESWKENWLENLDCIVVGDGENVIVDIVEGRMNPNVNYRPYGPDFVTAPIANLTVEFFPDYTDYDFSNYKALYITGSKGCVRNCTFCDIPLAFGKFRAREGNNILSEMVYQYSKHEFSRFVFTDSLINGSMRYFKEFIYSLASLRGKGRVIPEWDCHFIVRNEKIMKPEYFKVMKRSGCHMIKIGLESGSDSLRISMGKEYTNEDLDYTVKQVLGNDMMILLSVIMGHPLETDEDFRKTVDFFDRYKSSSNRFVITSNVMVLIEDTPLGDWSKGKVSYDELGNWVYGDNNFLLRMERQQIFNEELSKMGYKVGFSTGKKKNRVREMYKEKLEQNMGHAAGWSSRATRYPHELLPDHGPPLQG